MDVAARPAFRFFNHHHRVGAVGYRRTGGDFHAFAGVHTLYRHLSGVDLLDDAQRLRIEPAGAEGVLGDDSVTVHGGARERRHVAVGCDIVREHTRVGVEERDTFDARPSAAIAVSIISRASSSGIVSLIGRIAWDIAVVSLRSTVNGQRSNGNLNGQRSPRSTVSNFGSALRQL